MPAGVRVTPIDFKTKVKIAVRCTDEYHAWVMRIRDHIASKRALSPRQFTMADMTDIAYQAIARIENFDEPAPNRAPPLGDKSSLKKDRDPAPPKKKLKTRA